MRAIATFQPWDFDGLDLEPALIALADLGIDVISLGLLQPSVRAVRRSAADGPRVIQQPAGFHFQPDGKVYASSRIKPIAAKWLRHRNPIERIVRTAIDQNLGIHARLDFTDLSDVLHHVPLAGMVNVYGESCAARLCPSNPDANALMESVIEDVCKNYPFGRIELTGFGFTDRLTPGDARGAPQCSAIESHLLSLCFCPSCRDRAGRDGVRVDRVVSDVQIGLDAQFRLEPPADLTLEMFLQRHPDVAAFEESRRQTTLSLLATLRRVSTIPLTWRPALDDSPATSTAFSELFESIIVCGDAPTVKSHVAPDTAAWKRKWQPASRVEVALCPMPPNHADAQSLIRHVKSLCADGHTTLHFGPMGELPPPCLDWIRQAVRYAKRESIE